MFYSFRRVSVTPAVNAVDCLSCLCVLQNEDILKKCVADYQSKLKQMDERFQQLKKQAEDKLNEFV